MTPSHAIVLNWHVTEACNFRCQYCYAKWQQPDGGELIRDPGATASLLKALHEGFRYQASGLRPRLNFAGGEPLLHARRVVDAMRRARAIGFDVSLITNGSRLTAPLATELAPELTMLGISIDSGRSDVNAQIGRADRRGVGIDLGTLAQQIAEMRRINPALTLKINTVVNAANCDEDLRPLIQALAPSRWKVLRMLPVVTDNLAVNSFEFRAFVDRHRSLGEILCVEDNDEMIHSYVMVDPHGRFFQNDAGGRGYAYSQPILAVGAAAAFSHMAWSEPKFASRYRVVPIGEAT